MEDIERVYLFIQVVQASSQVEAIELVVKGDFDVHHPYNGLITLPENVERTLENS
jgi:hypothetical protein